MHGLRDDTETAGRETDDELDDDEEDRRSERDEGCATAREHEPIWYVELGQRHPLMIPPGEESWETSFQVTLPSFGSTIRRTP